MSNAATPFNRPPRINRNLPQLELVLPAAPQAPRKPHQRLLPLLAPLLTALVYVFVAQFRGSRGGGLLLILPMICLSLVTVGIGLYTAWEQRRAYRQAQRETLSAWEAELAATDKRLQELWHEQSQLRHTNDPAPEQLLTIVSERQSRLWERRPQDRDFMCLRIGLGDLASLTTLKRAHGSYEAYQQQQLNELTRRYRTISAVPLTIDLRTYPTLGIIGTHQTRQETLTTLMWQMSVQHSPDDVRLAAFWPEAEDRCWEWFKWLPHTRSLNGEESYRMLAHSQPTSADTEEAYEHTQRLCNELLKECEQRRQTPQEPRPFLLICICDPQPNILIEPLLQTLLSEPIPNTALMIFAQHYTQLDGRCSAYIDTLQQPTILVYGGSHSQQQYLTCDRIDLATSSQLAMSLAQIERPPSQAGHDIPRMVDFLELLHIPNIAAYDPWERWHNSPPTDAEHPSGLYSVPIGQYGPKPEHRVQLDLNEKHEGVHGMIAGTTGSGKSELLTTLILALAIYHHPDRLNLLLIDFKGGATFRELAPLPHTAGLVTDLAGNGAERALLAINSELDRRKELFARYEVANLRQYRNKADTPALPNILIAIDEFDEMARDYPMFIDELIRVAKQGRSLGVHLLFATQTPSNGAIKAGLKTNLTYWIALRVVDPEDSKLMIGSRAAANISNTTPGRAYKRIGSQVSVFQSALATMPYIAPEEREDDAFLFQDSLGRLISPRQRMGLGSTKQPKRLSVAEELIQRLHTSLPAQYAATTYRIWQEPLSSLVKLTNIVATTPEPGLSLILGLQDEPEHARQPVARFDLANLGTMVCIGSSGSGKTTTLRTCIQSLIQLYPPHVVQCCIINARGDGLGLTKTAHIGATLAHSDYERIERLLALIETEIQTRQHLFNATGMADWRSYRNQHPKEILPAWVLVIDDFPQMLETCQALLPMIGRLARITRSYGIFWIFSTDRLSTAIFPADLKSAIGQKIVLRLLSETDSIDLLSKPVAARIAATTPGRAFIPAQPQPREIQIAFSESSQVEMIEQVEFVQSLFPHIAVLPEHIALDLATWSTSTDSVPIATERRQLQPATWNYRRYPHLLLSGTARSGAAEVLQTLLGSLLWTTEPEQTKLFMLDYRACDLRAWGDLAQTCAYVTEPWNAQAAWVQQLEMYVAQARTSILEGNVPEQRIIIVIHGLELLEPSEQSIVARWARWIFQGIQLKLHILVSTNDLVSISSNGLIKSLKQERHWIIFGDAETSFTQLGLNNKNQYWPAMLTPVPQRALWVNHHTEQLVQFWESPSAIVAHIQNHCEQNLRQTECILD